MSGIPKSIYNARVNLEINITDVDDGVDFLVHAPMGAVQRGTWRVVGKDGEGWTLVIETELTCSRLLMGIMKGKAEGNVPAMGKAVVGSLEGQREKER